MIRAQGERNNVDTYKTYGCRLLYNYFICVKTSEIVQIITVKCDKLLLWSMF